jgi:hypothetical protein
VLHLRFQNLPHLFVELDRATMSLGRLVSKVAAYDHYRYFTHRSTGPPVRAARAPPGPALPDCRTRSPATPGPVRSRSSRSC